MAAVHTAEKLNAVDDAAAARCFPLTSSSSYSWGWVFRFAFSAASFWFSVCTRLSSEQPHAFTHIWAHSKYWRICISVSVWMYWAKRVCTLYDSMTKALCRKKTCKVYWVQDDDESARERETNYRRGHSIESTQCVQICIATVFLYILDWIWTKPTLVL